MKHTELHKKFLFTAVISSFLAGNSFSTQQHNLVQFNNYLDHLSIQGEQRSSLLNDFQYSKKLNLSTNNEDFSRYDKRRDEFDNKGKKDRLINEWEGKTKSPWPKHDGRSSEISQTRGIPGTAYEAHHIIPLGYNGKNKWWNITPLTAHRHIDIHSSSMFKELFSKSKGSVFTELFPTSWSKMWNNTKYDTNSNDMMDEDVDSASEDSSAFSNNPGLEHRLIRKAVNGNYLAQYYLAQHYGALAKINCNGKSFDLNKKKALLLIISAVKGKFWRSIEEIKFAKPSINLNINILDNLDALSTNLALSNRL